MKFANIKNAIGKKAEIHFYGDIVSSTWGKWIEEDRCPQDVQDFFKQLEGYEALDIYINSGGGSVFAGVAIYNMLKRHTGYKTVIIDGIAGSIASVIAMVGDKIKINSGAMLMIHKPMSWIDGNADEMKKVAETLEKIENSMIEIYQTKLKLNVSTEQLKKMLADETWMNGTDASKVFDVEVVGNEAVAHIEITDSFKNYKNIPDSIKNNNISEVVDVKKDEIIAALAKLSDADKLEVLDSAKEKPKTINKTESEYLAEIEAKADKIVQAKLKTQTEESEITALMSKKVIPALDKYVKAGVQAMLNNGKFEEVKAEFAAMEELAMFKSEPSGIEKAEQKAKGEYDTYNNIVKGGKK